MNYAARLAIAVCAFFLCFSCSRFQNSLFIIPPPTYPLSRPFVGYGVIAPSYTSLLGEPGTSGQSQGYLRRGAIVRIRERRALKKQGRAESWVLVEGGYQGWLREEEVDIYDYEEQAETASGIMEGRQK